jgi:hypothetical protein
MAELPSIGIESPREALARVGALDASLISLCPRP